MRKFFLSASLGAVLALGGATGALAAFDQATADSVAGQLSSSGAPSATKSALIAEIQSLPAVCGQGGDCAAALKRVAALTKALGLSPSSSLVQSIGSLSQDAAAAGGVTDVETVAAINSIAPTNPTGATTGGPTGATGGGTGTGTGGGSPGGGGGGAFTNGTDSAASPGTTG